jgi:spermidine/putrescine transport system permease protein
MVKRFFERFYVLIIFVLLYAPIAILFVLSFNASKSRAKWGGFTFKWYGELFHNSDIMSALYTTLIIAVLSATIATIIGTVAAMSIHNSRKIPKMVLMNATYIPILNPEIVTGISLMLFFIMFKINLGFITILLGHIIFNVPYVILNVLPKLRQLNKHTFEAALDLGATPTEAFFKVMLPELLPGIITGFLLSFTFSLDDFVITYFVKGAGINTLSTKIYSEVRKGIKPEMYALSSIMFLTILVLLLIVNKRSEKQEKKAAVKG